MCDVGFGRRMVFGFEERREQMRKREGRERNFGELKSMRESILKNYICYTIQLQYHYIFMTVL